MRADQNSQIRFLILINPTNSLINSFALAEVEAQRFQKLRLQISDSFAKKLQKFRGAQIAQLVEWVAQEQGLVPDTVAWVQFPLMTLTACLPLLFSLLSCLPLHCP